MKEIIIMAGAVDPEKSLLSILKKLFPECDIRIVFAGGDRGKAHVFEASNKEIGKAV